MHTLIKTYLMATAVFAALGGLWAVATPLAAVPDEPAHMIRAAAVVQGQLVTEAWDEFPAFGSTVVPEYVANTSQVTCFAFKPEVTPDCAPAGALDDALVSPTTIGTSAALNSPVYYYLVGWPTLILSGEPALFAMRFVNVAIFASFMGLAFTQLRRLAPRGVWAPLSFAVASTPMLLFLGGSVNPNAVEASGALALYLTVLSLLRHPPKGSWRLSSPLVVAVLAGVVVNTRSIGFLWVALAILVAVTQTGWRSFGEQLRTRWMISVLTAGGLVVAGSLYWFTQLPDYDQSMIPTNPTTPLSAFLRASFGVFQYGDGLIGSFGWLDTPAPAYTTMIVGGLGLGLLLFSIAYARGLDRWVPLFFAVLIVVVPAVIQTLIAEELGYIWQGRYLLAMYLCAVVAAGLALDRGTAGLTSAPARTVAVITSVALGLAHVIVFVHVLKRYVVGADDSYSAMFVNPDWQPPGTWIGLAALYALVVVTSLIVARRSVGQAERAAATTSADHGEGGSEPREIRARSDRDSASQIVSDPSNNAKARDPHR